MRTYIEAMHPTRVLVSATESDARAAATWVSTPEDTLLFAGPALRHPWSAADLLASRAEGWSVYALREDGCPVAVGSLRPVDGHAHLGRLLVDPTRRGQGLGRSLVTLLLAHARSLGHQEVTLNVAEHNHNARHLYESVGFIEAGRKPGSNGPPSIHMTVGSRTD